MSLAFQKLNGQGTSAYDLLQKTIQLVSEIQKLNYPDVYKLAKMFAPNIQLEAVTKNWLIDFGDGNRQLNFNGRYFGYFVLTTGCTETANSNNTYRLSQARIYDGNQTTAIAMTGYHGDDIVPMNSASVQYTGFGTSMYLGALKGIAKGYASVSFIGFLLGDAEVSPPLPEEPITVTLNNGSAKQINVAYVDLDSSNKTLLVEPLQNISLDCKKSQVVKLDFTGALSVDNVQRLQTVSKTYNANAIIQIAPPPNHNLTFDNYSQKVVVVTFKGVQHNIPANVGANAYTMEVNADENILMSFDGSLILAGAFETNTATALIYNRATIVIKDSFNLEVTNQDQLMLDVQFLDDSMQILSRATSDFLLFAPPIDISSKTEFVKLTRLNSDGMAFSVYGIDENNPLPIASEQDENGDVFFIITANYFRKIDPSLYRLNIRA